jgi:hypothetical protein
VFVEWGAFQAAQPPCEIPAGSAVEAGSERGILFGEALSMALRRSTVVEPVDTTCTHRTMSTMASIHNKKQVVAINRITIISSIRTFKMSHLAGRGPIVKVAFAAIH